MGFLDSIFGRGASEERVATYVLREHGKGRSVSDILADKYVQNRLGPEQVERLFERPEIVEALGDESIEQARADYAQLRSELGTTR